MATEELVTRLAWPRLPPPLRESRDPTGVAPPPSSSPGVT